MRNEAAAQTTGRYLAFIDADDLMSEDTLVEIKKALDSGTFMGGDMVDVRMDRQSLGLSMTWSIINRVLRLNGLSMYLFYTTREVFDAIDGVNEELYSTEDHDFATRIQRHGKKQILKYCNLRKGHIIKSARKFDEFGDWCIIWHPIRFLPACLDDQKVAYDLWYKPRRIPAKVDSSSTRSE